MWYSRSAGGCGGSSFGSRTPSELEAGVFDLEVDCGVHDDSVRFHVRCLACAWMLYQVKYLDGVYSKERNS